MLPKITGKGKKEKEKKEKEEKERKEKEKKKEKEETKERVQERVSPPVSAYHDFSTGSGELRQSDGSGYHTKTAFPSNLTNKGVHSVVERKEGTPSHPQVVPVQARKKRGDDDDYIPLYSAIAPVKSETSPQGNGSTNVQPTNEVPEENSVNRPKQLKRTDSKRIDYRGLPVPSLFSRMINQVDDYMNIHRLNKSSDTSENFLRQSNSEASAPGGYVEQQEIDDDVAPMGAYGPVFEEEENNNYGLSPLSVDFTKEEVDCIWNTRFQIIMENVKKLSSNSLLTEKVRIYTELSNLVVDFNETAKTYARIIINEANLPTEKKSLKPINLGGIAGGEKYLVNSILFKFAIDLHGMFGEDDGTKASKVAGADLRGLMNYHHCNIPGLHFPLMALVDFNGYRVIAISKLPIDATTLVYGSQDGGKTLEYGDKTIQYKLQEAGKQLNIKPHLFKGTDKVIYSASDVEGHLGRVRNVLDEVLTIEKDGRYYMIDFSRFCPPELPEKRFKGGIFYRFLRPEFLRKYPKPLNPDAFSRFMHESETNADGEEIRVATDELLGKILPAFGKKLDEIKDVGKDFRLEYAVHKEGIPLRYLGLLRYHTHEPYWKGLILIEMCARTTKTKIRSLLRAKKKSSDELGTQPYKAVIVNYLNLLFGNGKQSFAFWNTDFREALKNKYDSYGFSYEELNGTGPTYSPLRDALTVENARSILFSKVQKMLGFSVHKPKRFQDDSVFETEEPFDTMDLEELVPLVKEMNVAALAQGYVIKTKLGRQRKNKGYAMVLDMAIAKFEDALKYANKQVLTNLAGLYSQKGDAHLAKQYFLEAIEMDNKDVYILYKYAAFLAAHNQVEAAENYFRKILEVDPTFVWGIEQYASFLVKYRKHFEAAEQLYQDALRLSQNPTVLHNYALVLVYLKKFDQAEDYFKKSIALPNSDPEQFKNYAWFLGTIRKDKESAQEVLDKLENRMETR